MDQQRTAFGDVSSSRFGEPFRYCVKRWQRRVELHSGGNINTRGSGNASRPALSLKDAEDLKELSAADERGWSRIKIIRDGSFQEFLPLRSARIRGYPRLNSWNASW